MKLRKVGPNSTELEIGSTFILVSYSTPVALWDTDKGITYITDKKWSATTSKHISQWVGERKTEKKPQEFFDKVMQ